MTDIIEPVPLSDHEDPIIHIISTAGLMVAGQLDVEILRVTFSRLVEKWPKLSARMVKRLDVCFLPSKIRQNMLTELQGVI